MPITKCTNAISQSIYIDCDNIPKEGLEPYGLVFNKDEVTLTFDALNPRKVTAITLAAGATPYQIYNPTKVPFENSGSEMNADSAFPTFNKTVNFLIPNIGADFSRDVIEPMVKGKEGYIIVLPTKNKVADGAYIIIGAEKGAIATAGTRNLTDAATNGGFAISLTETGAGFETVTLTGATFEAAKATYDALEALAPTPS